MTPSTLIVLSAVAASLQACGGTTAGTNGTREVADLVANGEDAAASSVPPAPTTDGGALTSSTDLAATELCHATAPLAGTPIVDAWGSSPSGELVSLDAPLTVAGCTFTLAYEATRGVLPPTYTIWLLKTRASSACDSPTGARSLGTSYDQLPTGAIAANGPQRLVAVAFGYRFGLSGEDYTTSSLLQIDWGKGATLRQGLFVVKGQPNDLTLPAVDATKLTVTGCDVTVSGRGTIEAPPEAGTGSAFTARFDSFLAQAEQYPALSDSATNAD